VYLHHSQNLSYDDYYLNILVYCQEYLIYHACWSNHLVCCQINCNRLGLSIDEYILELIAISLDRISIGILLNQLRLARNAYRWASMVVLIVGLTVGLTVGRSIDSTWLC
jgi:hypothetical protein